MSNNKIPQPITLPLINLPYFSHYRKSDYWYGALAEYSVLQAEWIIKNVKRIKWPKEIEPYIQTAVSIHHQALIMAGNDRAYLALYTLRPVLERVAIGWTIHSSSTTKTEDSLAKLKSNNQKARIRATISFIDEAKRFDSDFGNIYDMVAQYFAHASRMDSVSISGTSQKDKLFTTRAKLLPLLLLMDIGHRLVLLISSLLEDQSIPYVKLQGGRDPSQLSIDLNKFVRLCAYIICEKHSINKGLPIKMLMKNVKDVTGDVGLNSIYRGGMELVRFGSPEDKPEPSKLVGLSYFAIGRENEKTVKVKLVKESHNGEVYKMSWSKDLEIDSTCLAFIAGSSQQFPLFDYITAFLDVIERNQLLNK